MAKAPSLIWQDNVPPEKADIVEWAEMIADTKAPKANPTFTGTVGGVTKAMVGLGNVDNTADVNKPARGLAALARPGDHPTAFGNSLTALWSAQGAVMGTVVADDDMGRSLQVTGAAIVAARDVVPVLPGRTYQAVWVFKRTTDSTDPLGDAVVTGVQYLDADHVSNGAYQPAQTAFAAQGQRMVGPVTFSLDNVDADVTIPAGTTYLRAYLQTYGTSVVTLIGWIELQENRVAGIVDADLAALAAAASAGAANESANGAAQSASDASDDRAAAEVAAGLSQAARDAAQADAKVYTSTSAGLAAVSEGGQFMVVVGDEIIRYEDVSGVATERARYPTAALVQALQSAVDDGAAHYDGTGPIYPIATDNEGRVILGYDATSQSVIGKGLIDGENASSLLKQAQFTGLSGIAPVLVDKTGRVLLGYDIDRGRVVAAGMTNAPEPTTGERVATPPIAKSKNHLLFYGQSLAVGANTGAVISTTQPYSNVTFTGGPRAYNGATYLFSPLKPLVEDAISPAPDGGTNRAETPCSGAASYATTLAMLEDGTLPADHVILSSSAGRGGWKISQLEKGQSWYDDVLLEHVSQAKAIDTNYACHAVGWIQGENDGLDQTSFAAYLADLLQLATDMDADIRAISAQTTPVYTLTYQTMAYATSWGDVQRAQLQAAKQSPLIWMVGPIYHLPKADGLHLTSIGSRWLGAYFGRAYKRLVHDGLAPRWLDPLSATLRDGVIRVRFNVPVRPLTLDTLNIGAATDSGFRVVDTGGTVAISSLSIDGDEVVIELGATPVGATTVRYALDYLGTNVDGSGVSGASGNLRDSAPETVKISGIVRNLYNWAPHFSLPVISIGE